jgi:hypothetical protein
MNNIYMKKKYTKKKARGFSKITGKSRISRTQTKQLSDAYDIIIKELSSSEREKLNKTMSKFQKTFKQKLQDKKTKSKKTPVYKSSKYYKTLQEIPAPLLDKILSKINEKYELKDDEAKNLLMKTILASNVSNVFNKSLDNILEFNKTILNYCKQACKYLSDIQSYSMMYPSSADEEEREIIDDEFRPVKQSLRDKMGSVFFNLNKLLIMRNNIVTQLDNILKIIDNKDDDSKIYKHLIDNLNIDYYKEFNNAELYNGGRAFNLDDKIEKLRHELPNIFEEVKISFERLLKTKLIYSKDDVTTLYSIVGSIYDATTSIDYSLAQFEEFLDLKKKSSISRKSRSRGSTSRR